MTVDQLRADLQLTTAALQSKNPTKYGNAVSETYLSFSGALDSNGG
jgi:hypothetical protein